MDKSLKILKVLNKFNTKKSGKDWDFVQSAIESCVASQKPIQIINFTCSTISANYMYSSKTPELYVNLDPKGNNLEVDLPKLTELYQALNSIYSTKVIILIGNTDPFYIYTEEATKLSISEQEFWKRFSKRWAKYKDNLASWIKSNYPNLDFQLVSWYELEQEWKDFGWDFRKQYQQTLRNISKYYDQSDLDWELNKLNGAFGPGKYFTNLIKPPQTTLKSWVKRKFAEYTVQGLWMKQIFSNAILLQNEKPSELRTKMYQPLIEEKLNSRLPVLYPYGIDNTEYQ